MHDDGRPMLVSDSLFRFCCPLPKKPEWCHRSKNLENGNTIQLRIGSLRSTTFLDRLIWSYKGCLWDLAYFVGSVPCQASSPTQEPPSMGVCGDFPRVDLGTFLHKS